MNHLSNILTTLKQASLRNTVSFKSKYNKLCLGVLEVLKSRHLIEDYKALDGLVEVFLKYDKGMALISSTKMISKPSVRKYRATNELSKVLNGRGVQIVSTSKGILASEDAKKLNVGGEVICEIF